MNTLESINDRFWTKVGEQIGPKLKRKSIKNQDDDYDDDEYDDDDNDDNNNDNNHNIKHDA